MKLKCCYLTIFYQQDKANATKGISRLTSRKPTFIVEIKVNFRWLIYIMLLVNLIFNNLIN